MADPTQNSRNPANSGEMAGMLQEVLGKFLQGVDDMLPAVVISYDRTENLATVRPLVKILATDGTSIDRAEIASIPVFQLGGGIAVLTFNILPGDLGWIKANDRDISKFMDSKVDEKPNTLRKHSFSDAVFFPDQFRKWSLGPGDLDAAVLQSLDGNRRISIRDDRIHIQSNEIITIDAGTTLNLDAADINITAVNRLTLMGQFVDVSATLDVDILATRDIAITSGTLMALQAGGDLDLTSVTKDINLVANLRVDIIAPTIQTNGNFIFTGGFVLAFATIASTLTINATTGMWNGASPNQVQLVTHTHPQANDSGGNVEQPTGIPVLV